jgi:putative transposase
MMALAEELGQIVGLPEACRQLNVPRSAVYRARQPQKEPAPRPKPARALSEAEQQAVREVLNSERFQDCSPYEVYAALLDDDQIYMCSISTMYRILVAHDEVRERRRQLRHPEAAKPQLVAQKPGEIWSWDITKLPGPAKWSHYYLYVIIDVFSRYVVGWLIADRESAALAEELIAQTCAQEGIEQEQLTLHADRGSPMRSKVVAELLADLGVTQSHSRPHTPDDNAISEAQFKTLKYRPDFPERFASLEAARAWVRRFMRWYNQYHRHTALGLLTPAIVHCGQTEQVQQKRQQVLDQVYQTHPERFVRGRPTPPQPPTEVWINRPQLHVEAETQSSEPNQHSAPGQVTTPAGSVPDPQPYSRVTVGQVQRSLVPGQDRASLAQRVGTAPADLPVRA